MTEEDNQTTANPVPKQTGPHFIPKLQARCPMNQPNEAGGRSGQVDRSRLRRCVGMRYAKLDRSSKSYPQRERSGLTAK